MQPHSKSLRIRVGTERMVLTDGLQPFLFRSSKGTLFLQAQLTMPPGIQINKKNVIPADGIYGTVVSRDGGKTWERWSPKDWQKHRGYFEGGITELPDGTVLMMEYVADVGRRPGEFVTSLWESKDDLKTLRGPIRARVRLPQAKSVGYDDGGRPYTGVTFHRTLLRMPNDDLLATVYCWFKGDNTPCSYLPKMLKFRCILLRSKDRGRHWEFVSTIAVDPKIGEEGYDEPVMVRLSKGPRAGRFICLMRTGCYERPIYQTASDDEGRTWSKPRPLWIRGVDPDLIELSDGTLACSFGWRTKNWLRPKPPLKLGNYVIFSRDQGETWANLTRLPIEPNANTPWTTCYTTVREIAPGKLFVVYDIGRWGMPVRYIGSREVTVV